jgi:hypothetical protein
MPMGLANFLRDNGTLEYVLPADALEFVKVLKR